MRKCQVNKIADCLNEEQVGPMCQCDIHITFPHVIKKKIDVEQLWEKCYACYAGDCPPESSV